MKPDASEEVRGIFNPTSTKVTGIQICEHFSQLANMTDTLANSFVAIRLELGDLGLHSLRSTRFCRGNTAIHTREKQTMQCCKLCDILY